MVRPHGAVASREEGRRREGVKGGWKGGGEGGQEDERDWKETKRGLGSKEGGSSIYDAQRQLEANIAYWRGMMPHMGGADLDLISPMLLAAELA